MAKRSKFSLSHYNLFTCDMGELVPCGLMEVLPGDTVQHATSALVRCSPMLAPVMHPVHARIHHWFVPHRLVWEDWEDFITGGEDGLQTPTFPTITVNTSAANAGTLLDYLGLPDTTTNSYSVSALPLRAYQLIWNEFYRDQDLQTPATIDLTAGPDTTTTTTLQNCAWEKDYFTSARPWEMKGPAITIPIGDTAPVKGIGIKDLSSAASSRDYWESQNTTKKTGQSTWASTANDLIIQAQSNAVPSASNVPQVYADLSSATGISINVLREALALQRYQEARARYGSRYTEYLRYLGVKSSDARLQRPEYLGGGKQTLQFSEVLQTSGNATPAADDQLGQLGGHGIGAMRSNRYRRYFEEHGYVISLMSVKPRTMYQNGVARTWLRTTKEDFWQKELQFIGQQEIWNGEIFADCPAGTSSTQFNGTFGYQDRYDEYRRMESGIRGEFRTSALNFWHFARSFNSLPTLNSDFIKSVPVETPFAVPSTDVLWIMANHNVQARRLVTPVGISKTF